VAELEQQGRDAPTMPMTAEAMESPQQFGLFAPSSAAMEALAAIEPDELTPRQALEALYRLKGPWCSGHNASISPSARMSRRARLSGLVSGAR
jgi:hypothetical protein